MAGDQNDPKADVSLKTNSGSPVPDSKTAGSAWADEKATAKAKHDRASSPTKAPSLGDALTVGGGQQSTPYQLETQADAIAKQTRRGDV